ncbi:hypothetical protein M7I_6022 [Glarea lozoyensis 74030]|uniref:Uncharacterized protein n=1 Tax=Glarea lozoyensis (strain ATCC 74030 / MF5533) TaxID=1104152 RepID=H0ETG0_GLAL7|nr:hypothetical protein M7I_6022 [Glarea lozoyensis 74030]
MSGRQHLTTSPTPGVLMEQNHTQDFDRIGQWIKENGVKEVELDNLWWGGAA